MGSFRSSSRKQSDLSTAICGWSPMEMLRWDTLTPTWEEGWQLTRRTTGTQRVCQQHYRNTKQNHAFIIGRALLKQHIVQGWLHTYFLDIQYGSGLPNVFQLLQELLEHDRSINRWALQNMFREILSFQRNDSVEASHKFEPAATRVLHHLAGFLEFPGWLTAAQARLCMKSK